MTKTITEKSAKAGIVVFWVAISIVAMSFPGTGRLHAQEKKNDKPTKANQEKVGSNHTTSNRLAKETSPYLLMHAHNPVDWYPWGEEALKKAKEEDKLIFLSIGYSSCHWCHVMERESFLDKEIAKYLNENFVCIKVDREERPDIDSIYMTSLHVFNQLTRSGRGGGWPLSMILTPEAKPVFGGTYFPARDGDRGVGVGFFTIVKRHKKAWKDQRDAMLKNAEVITDFTRRELSGRKPEENATLSETWVKEAISSLSETFDPQWGGFGYNENNPKRPKFPQPSNLFLLIDVLQRNAEDETARKLLVTTLERMAMGGIRDHLGGGFHRYSVDRFWRIPHYEKMLYDNGQLASVYAEAYQLTGKQEFRRVTEELLDFVLAEMTSPEGGFYSALDAESEKEEGKFYRWTRDELKARLSEKEYQMVASVFGVDQPPNFEEKYYALQFSKPIGEIAADQKVSVDELLNQLAPIRTKLMKTRNDRERPLTDTKILTSWNGLMIRGFADAGRILEQPKYLDAAKRCASFVEKNLRNKEGRMMRTFSRGNATLNAYLDDYAFYIDGLLALYRATEERKWLELADQLQKKQNELFWDKQLGGYFFTSEDHEELLARSKNPADVARPSGNSISAANLIVLGRALDNAEYLEKARLTVLSVAPLLEQFPSSAPRLLVSASELLEQKAKKEEEKKKP